MSDISPSKITTDAEFEKQVANADFETIKSLMARRAVAQGLVQRDIYDPNVLIPTSLCDVSQPQKFARAVQIDGVKHIVEADSELALEKAAGDLYRAQLQPTPSAEVARGEDGRFRSLIEQGRIAEDAAAQTELRLRIIRGETSIDDAVGEYLANRGIDTEALQQVSGEAFAAKWETAVQQFQERHPDYVGGRDNLAEFQRTLQTLNLVDNPSLSSIEAAFADMVRRNAYYENPEVTAANKIAEAKTSTELRELLDTLRPGGSRLVGR